MYRANPDGPATSGRSSGSVRGVPAGSRLLREHQRPQVLPEMRALDWSDRAACLGEDPELFFPIGDTGPALVQIAEAKAVCHRCPVMDLCLSFALDFGHDVGVWGALTEGERRELKRGAARSRHSG